MRSTPAPSGLRPARLDITTLLALPTTEFSSALSKDLERRGWTFVGPTTVYAFMQAMGLVNDHVEGCCVRETVQAERRRFKRPGKTAAPPRRGSVTRG